MPRLNVEDSPYRCPFDGKRMVVELDQFGSLHYCLHCLYKISEPNLFGTDGSD